MRRFFAILALTVLFALPLDASAKGWGNLKGQLILDEQEIKAPVKIDVNKDQAHCLSKGDLFQSQWVVDAKSKGVKWVMVWVAVEKEGKADHLAKMTIHETVAELNQKDITMDQPCCMFEPRVMGLRKGQSFIGKNSSPISHNMALTGSKGPNVNQVIAPGRSMTIDAEKWNPWYIPVNVACNIHPWMNAKVFCFNHPYFAVTGEDGTFEIKNLPAGKLRLIIWHEGMGWVVKDGAKGSDGKGITIEDGKTLDLKQVPLKYSD